MNIKIFSAILNWPADSNASLLAIKLPQPMAAARSHIESYRSQRHHDHPSIDAGDCPATGIR